MPIKRPRSTQGWLVALLLISAIASGEARADDRVVEELVKSLGGVVVRDENKPGEPIWAVHLNRRTTDADLKLLAKFKDEFTLRSLNLSESRVTDEGLKELACFKNLEMISLANTAITDKGLKELIRHKKIHSLNLSSTAITDEGVQDLAKFPNIQLLSIKLTGVTDQGAKMLKGLLPKCDVLR